MSLKEHYDTVLVEKEAEQKAALNALVEMEIARLEGDGQVTIQDIDGD